LPQQPAKPSQPEAAGRPIIGAMGTPSDITDEFDDESLRRSIEQASTTGTWRNDAGFEDPKLKEIAQKLATAPIENYAERRLRELQERAARKEQSLVKAVEPTRFADEPVFRDDPDEWRERVVPTPKPAAPAAKPRPAAEAPTKPPPVARAPAPIARAALPDFAVREWILPLGTAALAFGLGAAANGAVAGWTTSLLWRAGVATLVAGAAWRLLEVGRVAAAVSGAALYLVAFATTSAIGDPSYQFGMFLGVLVATAGGFVAGCAIEARCSSRYRLATLPTNDGPVKPC
jgi:hypothetical protein